MTHNKVNGQVVDVTVAITSLALDATCDWAWKWGWFSGSGSASASSTNSHLTTIARFESNDFASQPPHKSGISSCSPTISLSSINFSGGITASIANLFKSAVTGLLEDQLKTVACDELGSLGSDTLTGLLGQLKTFVEPYTGPEIHPDPLLMEKGMSLPAGMELVNFRGSGQDKHYALDTIVQGVSNAVDSMLGTMEEVTRPDGSVTTDLGINNLINSNTDWTGKIHLDSSVMGALNPLYSGSDPLTKTSISVTNVTIEGLNTFTTFKPMAIIGNQTISHQIKMQKLDLRLDIRFDMASTDHPDSIVNQGQMKRVVETATITLGLEE